MAGLVIHAEPSVRYGMPAERTLWAIGLEIGHDLERLPGTLSFHFAGRASPAT
jgi:hypothetical protein